MLPERMDRAVVESPRKAEVPLEVTAEHESLSNESLGHASVASACLARIVPDANVGWAYDGPQGVIPDLFQKTIPLLACEQAERNRRAEERLGGFPDVEGAVGRGGFAGSSRHIGNFVRSTTPTEYFRNVVELSPAERLGKLARSGGGRGVADGAVNKLVETAVSGGHEAFQAANQLLQTNRIAELVHVLKSSPDPELQKFILQLTRTYLGHAPESALKILKASSKSRDDSVRKMAIDAIRKWAQTGRSEFQDLLKKVDKGMPKE